MLTENYIWLYINEQDGVTYDNAFKRTKNLYCHNTSYNLFCPGKKDLPFSKKLESLPHSHDELWNPKKSNFSLLLDRDENPYFIKVIWKKLEINEEFADYLIDLVFKAHETAKKIKKEGNYGEIEPGYVETTIKSLITKWSYQQTSITIIDIAAELIISIACRHKFKNGNKRTALITGVFFLEFCGLSLLKMDKEIKYISDWEEIMVYIVKTNSKRKLSENQLIDKVKNFLDYCLTISYNWW